MSREFRNYLAEFAFWLTVLFVLMVVLMCCLTCQTPSSSRVEEQEVAEPTAEEVVVRPEASPRPRPRARDIPRPGVSQDKPTPAETLKGHEAAPACPSTPVSPARMRLAYEMLEEHIKVRNERSELDRVNGSVLFGANPPSDYYATPEKTRGRPRIQIAARKRGGGYWFGDVGTGCLTQHHPFERYHPYPEHDSPFLVMWDPDTGASSGDALHAEAQVQLKSFIDELIVHLENNPP